MARRNRETQESVTDAVTEETQESVTLEAGDAVTPNGVTETPDYLFEAFDDTPAVSIPDGVGTVDVPRVIMINLGHRVGFALDLTRFSVNERGYAIGGGVRNILRDASGKEGTDHAANILGRVRRWLANPRPGERAGVDAILGILRLVARTQKVLKPAAAAKATDAELRQAFGERRYARERMKAEAMIAPEPEENDAE